jgi:hypothetical protein
VPSSQKQQVADRTWVEALKWAALIVVIATIASAMLNPLIGRTVHWNIMAVLMPTLFMAFSFLFKKRGV